jgi:hypothetical protein
LGAPFFGSAFAFGEAFFFASASRVASLLDCAAAGSTAIKIANKAPAKRIRTPHPNARRNPSASIPVRHVSARHAIAVCLLMSCPRRRASSNHRHLFWNAERNVDVGVYWIIRLRG